MRTHVIQKCSRSQYLRCHVSSYSTSVQHRQTIASKNSTINAFVHVSEPPSTISRGLPLAGLTVAIKDNIATSSMATTCSSAMLKDFISPFDASVVELLRGAGADLIGKTNCDEFGMGSLNTNSIHGPVKNPIGMLENNDIFEERSAGGSSGGSAAAVAAGMCDAALGTDTGGSVRLPASYCGVVGFKPSYGLISRWGVVAYADSLDCVGILANDVSIVQRVFDQVAVYDPMDPTSTPREVREKSLIHTTERISSQETSTSILNGLKVGIPQEYFPSEMSSDIIEPVRKLIARLKSYGAVVIPVSLPTTSYALSSYYVLATAEASSNLARYDGVRYGSSLKQTDLLGLHQTAQAYARVRTTYFGPEVKKRILLGSYALSTQACEYYFFQAQKVRQLIRNDFDNVFSIPNYFSDPLGITKEGVDVLLHPSAIRTAPLLVPDENEREKSSLDSYVQDVLTVPASLAGLPALSIPVLTEKTLPETHQTKWPIGVSIVGQRGTDDLVLAVGSAISACQ